jgi:uncharacterized protein YyaL (SSP411 family)
VDRPIASKALSDSQPKMKIGVISPQDWDLPVYHVSERGAVFPAEISPAELEWRIRLNVFDWLPRQWDSAAGAFYGFYRAQDGFREPPQTVNLIASWQLMATYDRFGDENLLKQAAQALDFYRQHFTISHPMSVVAGGARDGAAPSEVWTKYTAEYVIGALGLAIRKAGTEWLEQAEAAGRFLIQAARHGYSPRYHLDTGRWDNLDFGWDSWGRVVEACLLLAQETSKARWLELAKQWGEHGLEIQAADGGFYLIDNEYYNTDLAADELRGLAFLFEQTGDQRYLQAAERFADWHLVRQRSNGSWSLTIDRDGNVVVPTVGPGDIPNLAIALLRLHHLTGRQDLLTAALRAIEYSLSMQILPEQSEPYASDPAILGGFWSWDPFYDYSVSADQATHHVRGMMFLLDYLGSL